MKSLTKTGRIIYAIPFLIFGGFHLMASGQLVPLVPSFFPGPGTLWVVITGIIFILVSLSLLTGKHVKEAALLLAFQLLVFIVTIWVPSMSNPEMQQMAMVNLMKDTSLLGAALMIAGMAEPTTKKQAVASTDSTPTA